MKFNFKKISAIAASALMTGMTMGVAAAANYPAPFVTGGSANVAIVYGTGSGVSNLDFIQAGNIQESLSKSVSGGSIKVEGGESFVLEKNSAKFYLGDGLNETYSTLKKGELKNFLADGTYKDGNVNVDYTQKILLGEKKLGLFTHKNYNDKEPTLGFDFSNGNKILDYKIEFKSGGVNYTEMEDTNLPLMGKEYYVLSADTDKIELLDSANKVVFGEGESKTISGKSFSIEFVTDSGVKLNVDGEVTKMLSLNSPHELNDGTHVIINEIMYTPKESGVSKVELSVGSGKILLEDGKRVKVNKDYVKGLEVDLADDGAKLTAITLTWTSDKDSFLTEDSALRMPVPFDGISLSYQGLDFPTTYEKISIESGEQLTLAMENYELPLMWWDGSKTILGEEEHLLVLEAENGASYCGGNRESTCGELGLNLSVDNRFLVTRMKGGDLNEVQTLYGEVMVIESDNGDDGNIGTSDDTYKVEFYDAISKKTITLDEDTLEEEIGDIKITLLGVDEAGELAYLNFTALGGTLAYDVAVSETGMHVTLPTNAGNVNESTNASIIFQEQDKDGDVKEGATFTVDVRRRSATEDSIHVLDTSVAYEKETKDVYIGYVPSALASKVIFDKTKDDNELEINYYGEEVTAKVVVIGGDTTISEGGDATLGNILVKDSEVGSVASKNLIIVGGSCINSAAAALVGGTKCGAAWTEATGIGAGEFLIKGYDDSTLTTRLALLVAGYEAEDTVKAVTYLTNKVVDTSKEYKGVTSTETAVVVE